ncbi:MAG TPA: isoprenylcysteine carboxylmethyltransferase family protein [Candidatus Acidoferrum sp.]|nr:isoprenylcysteine carboxylmethyltransferase family protein [Candidatus Acidoferrum sp.]
MTYSGIAGELWSAVVALKSTGWAVAGSFVGGWRDAFAEGRSLDTGESIYYAWVAFAVVWLIAALRQKRVQKRQPAGERLLHILWMGAAALLLLREQSWFMPLNARFIPERLWVEELGAWATVAGVAFAIWARLHLGANWSGNVTIRQDHSLIRTGPYTFIRHPIYTGMLVALGGTALAIGEYRGLLGFAMFAVGLVLKAKKEESFLAPEFGPSFEEHKKKTGFFLPRFS